jgi:flagellar basal-body rod protein FlgG
MDAVLALTLQGLQLDALRLERLAANLANVQTPGYRRDLVIAGPFAQRIDGALQAATAATVQVDERAGTLKPTGQPLDVALAGEGFFEVLTPAGAAYTRHGSFHLDARGLLVTHDGHAVMGTAGEIRLTGTAPFIDTQGRIFEHGPMARDGQPAAPVAQLKAMRFEGEAGLQRVAGGLLAPGATATAVAATPAMRQGQLENSNADAMHEMVELVRTMRHAESLQRAVIGYDDMLGHAIRKLGEAP